MRPLEFSDSILVISHDRWFLDCIATHILALEGDSRVTFFSGNYHEYQADKVGRLSAEGTQAQAYLLQAAAGLIPHRGRGQSH